jgi:polar amino acid transport system substrate-binding protein
MKLPGMRRSIFASSTGASHFFAAAAKKRLRSFSFVQSVKLLAAAPLLLVLSLFAARPAPAQVCGFDYVTREGDTLAQIAQRVYGSNAQWSIIFYANQDRISANAALLTPGQSIKIPCFGAARPNIAAPAAPAAPAPQPLNSARAAAGSFVLSSMVRRIEFLTADGFTPYVDRSLERGGLILDLLSSSMKLIEDQAGGAFRFQVSWVNDWAAHLNPLLITRAFDVGAPWTKLNCADLSALDASSQYKCQKFFFSDPFYEDVTVLFVKQESPITFRADEEVIGKTLCRTRGWSTFDLNKKGRNWITDNKIVLMQPQTPEDCFRMLDNGAVDAVVISDLTGRSVAASLGMLSRVRATDRPVHIETMHAIIAKTHPHARTILYYINSSLAKLRESGEYDRIVANHLERFWERLENAQRPRAAGPTASTEKKEPKR